MSRRKTVLVLGFSLIAILGATFLLRWNKSQRQGVSEDPHARYESTGLTREGNRRPTDPGDLKLGGTNLTAKSPSITPEEKYWRDRETAAQAKNVPINFWGRVVDQANAPLKDVQVVLSIREWYFSRATDLNSRHPKAELVTDATGAFELLNGNGDGLTVDSLTKAGYESELRGPRDFSYNPAGNFDTTPNNPVVFKMWKDETKQALITREKRLSIVPDGRLYTVDLVRGTLAEGDAPGDLQIWIKRGPDAVWGKRFGWEAGLTAIHGGMIEETNLVESMYLAPTEGYQKDFAFAFKSGDGNWRSLVSKRVYLKSRDGQVYGRLDIEIDPFYSADNQGRLIIKYAVNPNGGRILR